MNRWENLRRHLTQSWVYWLAGAAWFLILGLLVVVTDKHSLHLAVDRLKFPGGAGLFTITTYLGDRRVAWFMGIVLLFRRPMRHGATVLLAVIVAGILTEFLKYQVFGPVPRPLAFFGEPSPLHLIEGFKNHTEYSMPSGHAAIAFALFTALALLSKHRAEQVGYFCMAMMAAVSRVYLSEHFIEDILFGSLLGTTCAVLAHVIVGPVLEEITTAEPSTD